MDSSDPGMDIAKRHLPAIMNQFGCLLAKDAEGTPIASGTGTLVEVDGHKMIVTANHVADELIEYSDELSFMVFPPADIVVARPNTAYDVPNFRIRSQDRIILPRGTSLDVTAFRPPGDLAAVPHLRWIEASAQIQAVEYLRREYKNDEIPFSLLITGFPNFSRATDASRRKHLFSNFQCWGSLREFIDTPSILAGAGAPAPQFIFDIEVPTEATLPIDAPPLVRVFTRVLDTDSSGEREPIGGYSGAPVFYLSDAAHYLIGITKEGRKELGGVMFGTTINDIILEIQNAQVLGCSGNLTP
jgi:hypothetical protein